MWALMVTADYGTTTVKTDDDESCRTSHRTSVSPIYCRHPSDGGAHQTDGLGQNQLRDL